MIGSSGKKKEQLKINENSTTSHEICNNQHVLHKKVLLEQNLSLNSTTHIREAMFFHQFLKYLNEEAVVNIHVC